MASDAINPGLQYAKTYEGLNGCDTEIVIEFTPEAGGGLQFEAGLGLESLAKETEAALRFSVKVYATEDEIIVLAGLTQIRAAQFVTPPPCEKEMDVEIIRFSKFLVCKNTGEAVEATIAFRRADDWYTTEISHDSSAPTAFQTDPETEISYDDDGVTTVYPSFTITLSAADAPESCGVMYWDPLLTSITFGEIRSPEASNVIVETTDWALIGGIIGGVALLLLILAIAFQRRRRRSRKPEEL